MWDTAALPIDEAVQQTSGKAQKIQMNEEYHKAIKLQHATHIIADFGNTTYLSRNASVPRRAHLPSIHCHHRHWKTQLNPQLPMHMEYIYTCVIGSSFNCPGRRTCHSFDRRSDVLMPGVENYWCMGLLLLRSHQC